MTAQDDEQARSGTVKGQIGIAVIAEVLAGVAGKALESVIVWIACAAVGLILAAGWVRLPTRRRSPGSAAGRRLRRLGALTTWPALGAVSVLAGYHALSPISHLVRPQPCPAATELHAITARENVPALRAAAGTFVRDTLLGGCPAYRVWVNAAPSLDEMIFGFEHDWRRSPSQQGTEPFHRLNGARPHIWIPASTGEADYLIERVNRARARLGIRGSIDTEPMVLAVLGAVAADLMRELGQEVKGGGHELGELLSVARSAARLTVVYPWPGLSSAGLIAAADLSDLDPGGAWALSGAYDDSVSALLCRFLELPMPGSAGPAEPTGRARTSVALVVPRHSVSDYNQGDLGVEGCGGDWQMGRDALQEFSSPGFRSLDYPFVDVDWTGQPAPQLAAGRDAFRNWLLRHGLFGDQVAPPRSGKPAVRGSAELADALSDVKSGLHKINLHIALDGTGSMSRPPNSLRRQVRDAFPAVRQMLINEDVLHLWAFSFARERVMLTSLTSSASRNDRFNDLIQNIAGRPLVGPEVPVTSMIRKLGPGSRPFVAAVVTDGGLFDDDQAAETARRVTRALAETEPVGGVYVLVLGDGRCEPSLTSADSRAGHLLCAEAGPDTAFALRQMISTIREWS
ncbi:hypothetical protein [Acrocarpospora sp. B8E8]|uniref:hypothetical protein n=1 Tax=Acrocarpospora sp. B8E8 TaxID=3153572 RepID=UPI00325CE4C3